MKLSDLIKGCQKDDENCLNMLLQRYSKMIAIYFTRHNIPQEEIRSLCSDVFLHVWRFKFRFVFEDEHPDSDIEKHFINWLYLIAQWRVRAYFREKQTIKEKFNNKFESLDGNSPNQDNTKTLLETVILPLLNPEETIVNNERRLMVLNVLKILTIKEQEIIRLRVFESCSYNEVLEITGDRVSESIIRKRYERASKKLRDFMITNALDQYLSLIRNGKTISIQEFIQNIVIDKVVQKDLIAALEEECYWMNWFMRNKEDLERKKYSAQKKKNTYVWQHFIERKTYAEISGIRISAYKVRNLIKNHLRKSFELSL